MIHGFNILSQQNFSLKTRRRSSQEETLKPLISIVMRWANQVVIITVNLNNIPEENLGSWRGCSLMERFWPPHNIGWPWKAQTYSAQRIWRTMAPPRTAMLQGGGSGIFEARSTLEGLCNVPQTPGPLIGVIYFSGFNGVVTWCKTIPRSSRSTKSRSLCGTGSVQPSSTGGLSA